MFRFYNFVLLIIRKINLFLFLQRLYLCNNEAFRADVYDVGCIYLLWLKIELVVNILAVVFVPSHNYENVMTLQWAELYPNQMLLY